MLYGPEPNRLCTRPRCGTRGVVVQQTAYPGYRCVCSGPDQPQGDPKEDPTCSEGKCINGILLEGVNGTRALCVCWYGFFGDACDKAYCPNPKTRWDAKSQQCLCLYPTFDESIGCAADLCGPGAVQQGEHVRLISPPGTPNEYECVCDGRRGFVLQPSPLMSQSATQLTALSPMLLNSLEDAVIDGTPIYGCSLDCNRNHTKEQTAEACVCYENYIGVLCEQQLSVCPVPIGDAVPRTTFYAVVGGTVGAGVILALAVGIGVFMGTKGSTTATTSGTPMLNPLATASPSNMPAQQPVARATTGSLQSSRRPAERVPLLGDGMSRLTTRVV